MAREPRSNRSFGLIAAIYLFKCVKERKKQGVLMTCGLVEEC